MARIIDAVEGHIRDLIEAGGGSAEVRRTELAERFSCVPSQISYVIETRFTPERGYLVESRRGGGGFIRIRRVALDGLHQLIRWLDRHIGQLCSQDTADHVILRLAEEGFVGERETLIMRAAVRREALAVDVPLRDMIRARILRSMLLALLRLGTRQI